MFGYIYKITHIPSGRYYIGQHQGSNPETDNYYGSGTVWVRILKKHAKSEFKKTILGTANSIEELNSLEESCIGNLYDTDKLCMNRKSGGLGSVASEEWKSDISKKMIGNKNGKGNKGRVFSKETLIKMSISARNKPPVSDKTRQRISKVTSGKNNPMYGRKGKYAPAYGKFWFTNGIEEVLAFECPEGYHKGRKRRF